MIPIFDNHVHLQRHGRYRDAVKEFVVKGGTGFMLVNLPPDASVDSPDYFVEMYEEACAIRDGARGMGAGILLAVGPYPVTLLEMSERLGLEEAEEKMMKGVELAAEYVMDGRADAIGEVGRPHFQVREEIVEASNRIMMHSMKEALRADCAVIIHSEDATPAHLKEIAAMAVRTGMGTGRVVKHHCSDLIGEEENSGIFPSVKATREFIISSAEKGRRFLMETDYLDDLKRPGAVLGIGTVPKRTLELLRLGIISEEDAWQIHYENTCAIYGRERVENAFRL